MFVRMRRGNQSKCLSLGKWLSQLPYMDFHGTVSSTAGFIQAISVGVSHIVLISKENNKGERFISVFVYSGYCIKIDWAAYKQQKILSFD